MAASKFTASNTHFLTKPGLIICLVAIGRKENIWGHSLTSQERVLEKKEKGKKHETLSYESNIEIRWYLENCDSLSHVMNIR